MKIICTTLKFNGALEIVPAKHEDSRGHFFESYSKSKYIAIGVEDEFVQDNRAYSEKSGTIRGLHFQTPPFGQAKLIWISQGRVLDIFVDIREGSPTYGQWASIELSADKGNQLYLPIGFAHGYITLVDNCEMEYKVSDYYAPECESGIRWDDPTLKIDWGKDGHLPVLSDKDMNLPYLSEIDSPFVYQI